MQIRVFTAVALLAALGLVTGCGDAGNEPARTGDTTLGEGQVPTPGTSMDEERDLAGAGETTSDRTDPTGEMSEPGQDALGQTDPAGQSMPGELGGEEQLGMTEFAALDTDSDGRIAESEWRSELFGGLEFDEVDLDSSGDVDRDEVREAMAAAGSDLQQDVRSEMESAMDRFDDPESEQ